MEMWSLETRQSSETKFVLVELGVTKISLVETK